MVRLERLRRNDKSYKELVFYENDFLTSDHFLELVAAILLNGTVQTVRFRDCNNPKWSVKQLTLLFAAIAHLPRLRLISMSRTKFPLAALNVVFSKAMLLQEMDIWECEFFGKDSEVLETSDALKIHPALQKLGLKRVRFLLPPSSISNLDPFLAAAHATLDSLEFNQVEWGAPGGAVSTKSLTNLDSSHLTQLSLEKLKLETGHFRAMVQGLSSCTCSLRDLQLCYISMAGDDDAAAATLAKALVGNTSVKKLVLYACQLSDQATMELAKMLRVSSSIEYLDLSENQMGDKGAIELANALLESSSMKRVELYQNNHIGERGIQAMVDLAEQNLVLEALEVFTFSTHLNSPEQIEVQRKINAFMDMNDMGRARQNPGKRPKVWYE
jgi:hypothetical protein